MHLNNGLDIPPRNKDILETSILEILRTYNASMHLAGPSTGEGNYVDSLGATPLSGTGEAVGYVFDAMSTQLEENEVRNSKMEDAALGSTPPSSFIMGGITGVTTNIVEIGSIDGHRYVDLAVSGTAASTGDLTLIEPNSLGYMDILPNEVATSSVSLALMEGSWPARVTFIGLIERNAGGSFLTNSSVDFRTLVTDGQLVRVSCTRLVTNAAAVFVSMALRITAVQIGDVIDFTIRITQHQVNKGNSTIYFPTPVGSSAPRSKQYIPAYQATTGFKPILAGNYLSYAKASHTLSNWTITGSSVLTLDEEKNLAGDVLATTLKRTSSISSLVSATITKPLTAILPFSVAFLVKCTKGRYLALRAQGAYPARSDIVFDFLTGNVSVFLEAAGVTETSSRMTRVSPDYWLCQAIFLLDGHSSASVYLSVRSYIAQVDAIDVGPDWAEVAIDSHAVAFVDTYIEPPFPVIPGIVPQYSKNGPFSWKFDGVDDRLAVIKPTIPNGAVSHFRIIALKMPPTAPGTNQVAVSGASAVASVRLAHMTLLSGGFNIDGRWVDGAGATAIPANHTRAANEKLVVRMSHVAGTYTLASKGDIGAAQSTSITPAALAAYTATGERIGCSYATGVDNAFSSWEIYGIISGNGNPTAGEILAMENFLAGHAGFTPLP